VLTRGVSAKATEAIRIELAELVGTADNLRSRRAPGVPADAANGVVG
jgi:hypothetical protein